MMMILRWVLFGACAWGFVALSAPGVDSAELVTQWSRRATTFINIVMLFSVVLGITVAIALATEKGHINSPFFRRIASGVRRIGYRLVPPVVDRYTEASAIVYLEALGYPVDEAGSFGAITRRSVQRFQREQRLRATGWLDPVTVDALRTASRKRDEASLQGPDTGGGGSESEHDSRPLTTGSEPDHRSSHGGRDAAVSSEERNSP